MMLHVVTGAIPATTYKSAFLVALTIIAPVTRVNNISTIGHNSKKWFFYGLNSVRNHIFSGIIPNSKPI